MRVARTGPLLTAALMAAFVAGARTSPAVALDQACYERPTSACVLEAAVQLARALPKDVQDTNRDLAVAWVLLGKVDRAVEAARKDDIPDKGLRWFVTELAEAGRFDTALQLARRIAGPQWRSGALLEIAEAAITAGQGELASRLVEEARRLDVRSPVTALHSPSMAGLLTRVGRLDQALEVAGAMSDPRQRAEELQAVVKALAEAGRIDEASRVAGNIEDPAYKSRALLDIAAAHVRARQDGPADRLFEAAWQAAETVSISNRAKGNAQQDVIAAMVRAGRLAPAEPLAAKIADPYPLAFALADIGAAHTMAGQTAQARRALQDAMENANRAVLPAFALTGVVRRVASAGAIDEAERLAATIDKPDVRTQALSAVARRLAEKGDLRRARRIIATLPAERQAGLTKSVLTTLAHAGVRERRMEMVSGALELAMKPWPGLDARSQGDRAREIELRVETLVSIGKSLAEAGL